MADQPADHAETGSHNAEPQRILPENTLQYQLFLPGEKVGTRTEFAELEALRKSGHQLSQELTKGYIWQREEFSLELHNENGLSFLQGLTDYGDAVEDEWLIVYMLLQLTKSYPRLWIRACDSDGEFLLIEAANVIPKWLSPEIDQNRVWIHDGRLLIVPLNKDHKSKTQRLSLRQAVDIIGTEENTLIHSPMIEAESLYRLEKYPQQIEDSTHHSLVTIPRKLAYVLHALPKSVAPATEAFYLRDPVAVKALSVPNESLVFAPDDLVTVSVRFSRVLFAQLRSQHFDPPPMWQKIIQDAQNSNLASKDGNVAYRELEMGMKLTCGFEMTAVNAAKSKSRVERELAIILEDLEEDGVESLPSDQELATWKDVQRNDDDSWLDINYEDFEEELAGKARGGSNKGKPTFGDAQAHTNLRKIVSRFEDFLNDDTAGLDGAELDSMDIDDDDDDLETDGDSGSEDKEASFDEEEFSRMMREMMGLSPGSRYLEPDDSEGAVSGSNKDVKNEDARILELSAQMEAELNQHGALKLDQPNVNRAKLKSKDRQENPKESDAAESDSEDKDSDEQVDIDYNLAKNILESFKSQGGLSGPTGNLLGMMGIQLPRDEDHENGEDD